MAATSGAVNGTAKSAELRGSMKSASNESSAHLKPESSMSSAHVWDIYSPPPGNSLKGTVIPSLLTRRRRRISVEIHEVKGSGESEGYEECVIRILTPESSALKRESKQRGKMARRRANRGEGGQDHISIGDDQSMISGLDEEATHLGGAFEDKDETPELEVYKGWKAKYKFPLKMLEIKSISRRHVVVTTIYRNVESTRDFIFDTEQQAQDFSELIGQHKKEDAKRIEKKFRHNLGGIKLQPREVVTLLIEIVSGTDLPVADLTSSDPFVICWVAGKEVHRTDHISKSLDPVWTLKNGSLFLVTLPAKELFQSPGLLCEVFDYDVGKNEKLGQCTVPPKVLYEGTGERLVYPLENSENKGSLAIRCRQATSNDKKFMEEYMNSSHIKGSRGLGALADKAAETQGAKSTIASVVGRNQKTERVGDVSITKYKVRPTPDPKRKEETEWMTEEELNKEVLKDSRQWIDTGSGECGRCFIEILHCDDLPNLDSGGFVGNKTDAFVALVYEDSWAKTDVIADTLHPRFLPWTKRAFIFHIFHPSSDLFIGVFDFDGGLVDNHDLIGRIAINISAFTPNTTYTLTYKLYPSARVTDRTSEGTITLRLRVEIDDARKALLTCLEPPTIQYVNVKKKKDFKVIQQACMGGVDVQSYSLKVLTAYVDELSGYSSIAIYIEDAIIALLLWRPQFHVKVFDKNIDLPLHSLLAFIIGVTLVERPQLVPSFFFASISWLLLSVMIFRRHNPNPWRTCPSYLDFLKGLVTGTPGMASQNIQPHQYSDASLEYETKWKERMAKAQRKAERAAKEAEEEAKLAAQEQEAIGDTDNDISTKKGGISIDPLRPVLEPLQGYVAILCDAVRFVRDVVTWEESYLAFWATTGCLVLSFVCLFVPWFFIIRWTSRLLAWTLLGPWMRLVDIYFYSKIENMTEEEIQKARDEALEKRRLKTAEAVLAARIERENALKLKEMKKFLFGKFIMKVPVLKVDRWRDYPLPESKAEAYKPKPLDLASLAMKEAGFHRTRVPGQRLHGDMIPTIESQAFTDAPVGQATKKHAQKESDAGAYAMVGGVVAGAAVLTWFGVPMLSSMAASFMG